MSAWGKRSKVRLHSGGISPSEVRLRRRGASEKKTAPGRDIRDIGPDRGPRLCRHCGTPFPTQGRLKCETCLGDRHLVADVKRELARLKQPPLGTKVPKGSPLSKKRRQAEAALDRMRQRKAKTAKRRAPNKPPAQASARNEAAICPRCFTELPMTRRCDNCTDSR